MVEERGPVVSPFSQGAIVKAVPPLSLNVVGSGWGSTYAMVIVTGRTVHRVNNVIAIHQVNPVLPDPDVNPEIIELTQIRVSKVF